MHLHAPGKDHRAWAHRGHLPEAQEQRYGKLCRGEIWLIDGGALMKRKFDEQLLALKNKVVSMGDTAQAMVRDAMKALVERNEKYIHSVVQNEDKLDHFQVEIDNEAIRLMAIQSPVAYDLRLLLMVARINTELERVGDLCVNMCENVKMLLSDPPLKPLIDLPKMAEIAASMLHECLQAFLESSSERALAVIQRDDEVDALNDQIFR